MGAIKVDWRLYVVLDVGILGQRDPILIAEQVLAGGATVMQLRAKNLTVRRQAELVQRLLPLTRAHAVPLIVNDQVDLALAAGADGVHLGVDDLPVALARRIMPDGIIGYSPVDLDDARAAVAAGADYLGVGPFAGTQTKADAGVAIGAAGVGSYIAATAAPVVAIGGINQRNVADARATGAAGVAVASAVILASDPTAATRALLAVPGRPHGGEER